MTKEQVDLMLSQYREKSARCAHLEAEIVELERLVKQLERTIVDDEVNITAVLSDMPKGNKTSDPTGKLGMLLAEGFKPQRIREIEDELKEKKDELQMIMPCVVFVQAWLSGLNDRERMLVDRKIIDACYWRLVVAEYAEKFGEAYSKDGLRNILSGALAKIYRIAA